MNMVRKITNDLAIAGQPAPDKLPQLVEEGYRSVVNLRSPDEAGFWNDEQIQIEQLGLCYVNYPIQSSHLTPEAALRLIQQISDLPKPMLVHCDTGIRSSVIALMQVAMKQGMRTEDAFQKVTKLGLLNDGS
ncbi:hypothetical protein H6F95_05490 [Cyanobacteria bacterium FACHB-471]|nr:hypothetical protein [Cyanobacteria bacterium FACHB-471]